MFRALLFRRLHFEKKTRFYATKQFDGTIPMEKLDVSYSPFEGDASGPSARAEVKFRVKECDWIPSPARERFFETFKHRIDRDGYFVVRSERTRVGSLNVADCLDKLRFSIRECADSDSNRAKDVKQNNEELRRKKEIESKMKLQMKTAI